MLRRHAISRCSNNAVANRSYLRATGLAITLLMVPLLAFALRWDKAIAGIIWGLEPPSSVIRLLPKPASHVKLGIYNDSEGCNDCDAFDVEMFFADWTAYDRAVFDTYGRELVVMRKSAAKPADKADAVLKFIRAQKHKAWLIGEVVTGRGETRVE